MAGGSQKDFDRNLRDMIHDDYKTGSYQPLERILKNVAYFLEEPGNTNPGAVGLLLQIEQSRD